MANFLSKYEDQQRKHRTYIQKVHEIEKQNEIIKREKLSKMEN